MINGANGGWNSSFPINGNYSSHGSYSFNSAYSSAGYIQQCKPQPQPKGAELWCLPITNFRIDAGKTDLYSKKVSIDWPEFRPQSPIFSGPSVRQDTTDIIGTPAPNYNFDDCYFGDCTQGQINQLLPGFQSVSQGYASVPAYIDYSYGGMPTKW